MGGGGLVEFVGLQHAAVQGVSPDGGGKVLQATSPDKPSGQAGVTIAFLYARRMRPVSAVATGIGARVAMAYFQSGPMRSLSPQNHTVTGEVAT
jgi:hypothetical protein